MPTITSKIVTVIDYDTIEVNDGVFVYRRKEVTRDSRKPAPTTVEHQGVTDAEGAKVLAKGLAPKTNGYMVVSDSFLADIKTFGYSALHKRDYKGMNDRAMYDHITNGGAPENIVRVDGDHLYWNIDGSVLPAGIYFDYMSSRMNNSVYDLEAVIAILKGRDDVVFCDDRGNIVEPEVLTVPYYNNDSGKDRYLRFFWRPTQEQADILAPLTHNNYRAIFDQDMLGIRSAMLVDNFHGSVKMERDEDEDDDD